ncbi:MAG: PTS glucose transporter subunit IIA, partial [Bacillota bacterium]|nr:PTS glucose transporter subunit IIA [Bacillota bacterium]
MSKEISLGMPICGKVIGLIELNDYLFNKKLMGDGAAIIPSDNTVYSPADGEINLIYETKHALGIKTFDGIQIIIHIGLDTARLQGKGFTLFVSCGDLVKKGDKILSFDFEYVSQNSSVETPVVIA